MSQKREFTGVFIPAHVWVSTSLSPAEKILFGEVMALSQKRGYCDARLNHYASLIQCSTKKAAALLLNLEKLGFIAIEQHADY